MTASAAKGGPGEEGSFSSFSPFCFVSCFLFFSRAVDFSKKKKKGGCGQANKKAFRPVAVFFLILRLTAIKYCYKVSFLHTQEIVLWHFSLIAFVKARFRAIFGCDF